MMKEKICSVIDIFVMLAVVVIVFWVIWIRISSGDRNCSSFVNQRTAQTFYNNHEPQHDPYHLDGDGDKIACEGIK